MKLKHCSIAAAAAFAFATAVHAQSDDSARKAKDAEEERIEAQAKAAKERCDQMKGNAKDLCMAEAKGQERIAKAELDAKHNPSPRNQRRAAEAKVNAEYDVAKQRCDDQKGEAKDQCEKQAKEQRDQARAQIRQQYAAKQPERRTAAGGGSARPERGGATPK
ncbi:MAG TPA: hypothetical protein VML57_02220 [Burkholderiales bacterium]|nr:hypothetical protein [Burkholderiales bacterium]